MVEKTADRDRFDWRLLVYAALCACFVFIPIEICPLDLSLILKLAVVFFLLLGSTALLINAAKRKNRRRFLPILSMLAVFWASSAAIVAYDVKESFPLRTDVRWLVWSNDYKADVLTQPASGNGEFRHIEWDGWGFPGAGETVVYLVFDPRDSLSRRHPAVINPASSKGFPVPSLSCVAWRTIGTPFCITPMKAGANAIKECPRISGRRIE